MAVLKFTRWDNASPEVRFWVKVDRSAGPDACWPWLGSSNASGHGEFWVVPRQRRERTHRYAYELTCGPIPEGLHVLHACDNPPCCNPRHLHLGTHAENMREASDRGRMQRGEARANAKLTEAAVRSIRARVSAGELHRVLAADFSVGPDQISRIVGRKRWGHVA